METSIFLAKFWGWYLIIFFLVLSLNPKRIRQIFEDLKDQKFVILTAFMAIVIGLLNILFHNTWESDWTIIITLIGWGALLEGLLLLAFPNLIAKWLEYIHIKLVQVIYILMFLVGIFLLNMGYNLVPY
tara:strand:- start:288 stop:674 length:387 start_codon:yes stop_codon:yes gene_type:complete